MLPACFSKLLQASHSYIQPHEACEQTHIAYWTRNYTSKTVSEPNVSHSHRSTIASAGKAGNLWPPWWPPPLSALSLALPTRGLTRACVRYLCDVPDPIGFTLARAAPPCDHTAAPMQQMHPPSRFSQNHYDVTDVTDVTGVTGVTGVTDVTDVTGVTVRRKEAPNSSGL